MCYNLAMTKPRVLSGIQPSGKLHIGNYLGALKNFVGLQNSRKYECFFMLADYHSITEDYDAKQKPQQILDLALDYLAIGLDPKKSVIFLQSLVPEHTELSWIFSTITPASELARMTQYKDKASRQEKNINAGLFTYPVLQAVDILIYKPRFVPVGDDQLQHLEFNNEIVRRFNNRFGKTFEKIQPLLTKAPRVMSMVAPNKKMSKSEPEGCVYITDTPQEIVAKIRKAVTDTGPEGTEKSQGVANLFLLLENFGTSTDIKKFNDTHAAGTIRYAELKEVLAQRVADHFANFRKKRAKLSKNITGIKKILISGSKQAQKVASATLAEVKQKIGLAL